MAKKIKWVVKNPFSYGDTRSMLIWKVAQCCVYVIQALWENPTDSIRLSAEMEQLNRSVAEWMKYNDGNDKSKEK